MMMTCGGDELMENPSYEMGFFDDGLNDDSDHDSDPLRDDFEGEK